jgi:hypothetical protein
MGPNEAVIANRRKRYSPSGSSRISVPSSMFSIRARLLGCATTKLSASSRRRRFRSAVYPRFSVSCSEPAPSACVTRGLGGPADYAFGGTVVTEDVCRNCRRVVRFALRRGAGHQAGDRPANCTISLPCYAIS